MGKFDNFGQNFAKNWGNWYMNGSLSFSRVCPSYNQVLPAPNKSDVPRMRYVCKDGLT